MSHTVTAALALAITVGVRVVNAQAPLRAPAAEARALPADAATELRPGSGVAFPDPVRLTGRTTMLPVDRIYLRLLPQTAAGPIWEVEPSAFAIVDDAAIASEASDAEASDADGAAARRPVHRPPAVRPRLVPLGGALGIGFEAPQLPYGTYLAWYDAPTARPARQSMTVRIVPTLRPAAATVYGRPGSDVTIRVGPTGAMSVLWKGAAQPTPVRVSITLRSATAEAAELVPGQAILVEAGSDGFASWRVHIKSEGTARFVASAAGFAPAVVDVIGRIPPPPPAELLQSGDVLLTVESTPATTWTWQFFEKVFYGPNPGGRPMYTHAALYVGRVNGQPTVAEMAMDAGYTTRSLDAYLQDSRKADVFRWSRITAAQQNAVAALGLSYGALAAKDWFGNVNSQYAFPQWQLITDLSFNLGRAALLDSLQRWSQGGGSAGDAADKETLDQIKLVLKLGGAVSTVELNAEALLMDLRSGGTKGFTAPEFIAWCYDGAGLTPQLEPWPAFKSMGLWTTKERHFDLTTASMLARSQSFQYVATLK